MTPPLHLLSLDLSARDLGRLAGRRSLADGPADQGYLVHSALTELFGALAPKPFAVDPRGPRGGDTVEILGYGPQDGAALADHARAFADPAIFALLADPAAIRSKPMPGFATGRRLGFRVRVCPTVRRRTPWPGRSDGIGAEQDAFLHAVGAAPGSVVEESESKGIDRATVYRAWLDAAFARSAAVTGVTATLVEFRREGLLRRGAGRKARRVELPAATFDGALTVADADGFAALLARGLGRHRAFGFGMLLLRPPG